MRQPPYGLIQKKNTILSLYIKCKYKNTLITITNPIENNKTLLQLSSKSLPVPGKYKNTTYFLRQLCLKILTLLQQQNCYRIRTYIHGIGNGRYQIARVLSKYVKIASLTYSTSNPFNGCRSPKPKRR